MSHGAPTPAQSEAARRNGALGGRPRSDNGPRELQRQRDRARREGRDAASENPRFWRQIRDDTRQSMAVRMDAARELSDRYGDPRQQVTAIANVGDIDPPKLFDLTPFDPPPNHDPASPNGDDLSVHNTAVNGNGETVQ